MPRPVSLALAPVLFASLACGGLGGESAEDFVARTYPGCAAGTSEPAGEGMVNIDLVYPGPDGQFDTIKTAFVQGPNGWQCSDFASYVPNSNEKACDLAAKVCALP